MECFRRINKSVAVEHTFFFFFPGSVSKSEKESTGFTQLRQPFSTKRKAKST